MGLSLYGTDGTVAFLHDVGIEAQMVRKVQEGSPNVIDMIRNGEIRLIINTPKDKQSRQDHYQIMRTAVELGIPYITTTQAAKAAANAIDAIRREKITTEPLGHYIGGPG
jgi:carbamoyl-phosphate synthase large subunit